MVDVSAQNNSFGVALNLCFPVQWIAIALLWAFLCLFSSRDILEFVSLLRILMTLYCRQILFIVFLPSPPQVVSTLRLKHNIKAEVCQLTSCDYIVSNRMAVKRKTASGMLWFWEVLLVLMRIILSRYMMLVTTPMTWTSPVGRFPLS